MGNVARSNAMGYDSQNMTSGYFRSKDGLRLYYSLSGKPGAPTLLFCYGLVCSKLQWKYQMEYFEKDYQVLYMDYRGHGHSDKPNKQKVTIADLANDLKLLLEELQIGSAVVLGHSLGVNVCLDLYRIIPEKINALVLANGTPKDPFETMFHHNFLQVSFPFLRLAHEMLPKIIHTIWTKQGDNPLNHEFIGFVGYNTKYAKKEDIREYLRNSSTIDINVFMTLLADFTEYDATHWLHEIHVPTLILAGEDDLITPPKNQRLMHKLIPKSQYLEIKEGSHCTQMEQVELVNSILEKFIKKILMAKPKKSQKEKSIKNKKSKSSPSSKRTASNIDLVS